MAYFDIKKARRAQPNWHDWVLWSVPNWVRIVFVVIIVFAFYATSSVCSDAADYLRIFALVTSLVAMVSLFVPNYVEYCVKQHRICLFLQHGMPSCVLLGFVFNVVNLYDVKEVVNDDELQNYWNKALLAWNRGLEYNWTLFFVILFLQCLAYLLHQGVLCQMERCTVITDTEFGDVDKDAKCDFTQKWAHDALTISWLAVVMSAMQWAIFSWNVDSSVDAVLGTTCATTKGRCALWTKEATCMDHTLMYTQLTVLKDVCVISSEEKPMYDSPSTYATTSIQFTSDATPSQRYRLTQLFNTTKGENFREKVKTAWHKKVSRQHAWVYWCMILVPTVLHHLRLSNSTAFKPEKTKKTKKSSQEEEFPVSYTFAFAFFVVLAQVGFTMYITVPWVQVFFFLACSLLLVVLCFMAAAGYFKGASLRDLLLNALMLCAIGIFAVMAHKYTYGDGVSITFGGATKR